MNRILAYLALPRVAKILHICWTCFDEICFAWVVNSALIKKKIFFLGFFEIFPFENWRFLHLGWIFGILSINPANKVHSRKCFDYNFG